MAPPRTLRIVLLTRWGALSGVLIAEALTRSRHQLVGIVCERRLARRMRFDRWALQQYRTHGPVRIARKLLEWSAWRARSAVRNVLPAAWRRRCAWKMVADVQRDLGIPVHATHDINDAGVRRFLESLQPDLLILANTGIAKRDVLAAAPEGCLNIHLGVLPKYRGLASVFWALYHGEPEIGVSIHYASEGVDAGDLIAQSRIPVGAYDTEDTLTRRAQERGAELMRQAVEAIAAGAAQRIVQDPGQAGYFHWPTRQQRRELDQRLRRRRAGRVPWKIRVHRAAKRGLRYVVGTVMWLIRGTGRRLGWVRRDPAVRILMYHKVCDDDLFLSIPPRVFEMQMAYLSRHYQVLSLKECVELIRSRQPLPPRAVVVTFDDGYADNYTHVYPILQRYRIPATIFLTAQYMGTDQRLHHDQAAGVHAEDGRLLSWEQIQAMAGNGIHFGSHGLSHARLSTLSDDQLREEVEGSKRLLESRLNRPVEYFSYPFGTWLDFDERVVEQVRHSGYLGACTALEGTNTASASPYHLQRTMVEASDTLFLFKRMLAGDLDVWAMKDTRVANRVKRWYHRWLLKERAHVPC